MKGYSGMENNLLAETDKYSSRRWQDQARLTATVSWSKRKNTPPDVDKTKPAFIDHSLRKTGHNLVVVNVLIQTHAEVVCFIVQLRLPI